jgi:hypothetical protein
VQASHSDDIKVGDLYFYADSVYFVSTIVSGATVFIQEYKNHGNYSYITIEYLKNHTRFEPTALERVLYGL